MKGKRFLIGGLLVVGLMFVYWPAAKYQKQDLPRVFVVNRNSTSGDIRAKLAEQKLITHPWLFNILYAARLGSLRVADGGYRLPDHPSMREIAATLTSPPSLIWVVIPEGLRKEQTAKRMATALHWTDLQTEQFLHPAKTPFDLADGFYFPDTYLIPVADQPEDVLKLMEQRFDDQLSPYYAEFRRQNMKYTTGIILASILEREAAGRTDMPLIAGILWNRLLKGMKLEVDATLQYARGDTGSGYWAPIGSDDKNRDSSFNTYQNSGLPPQPIANPGITAIKAVLFPETTDCLYYLHDHNRQIHCAETYAEHLQNIDTYLRH